jgi:uncharacterized protein
MRIDVTQLVAGLNELTVEESAAQLHLPTTPTASDSGLGAAFVGSVRADLRITRSGDELLVDADLSSAVDLECARCLAPFRAEVETSFRVFFRRAGSGQVVRSVEDQLDEGGLVYYGGRYIDLSEAVREAMLLALPMRPLCREDCRGLCAVCGADRNTEACTCAEGGARLAAGPSGAVSAGDGAAGR